MDAEDEVQNAYWKAFQCLDQVRAEGSFAAWLGRIVENQCLMRIRQERNAKYFSVVLVGCNAPLRFVEDMSP